MNLRKVRFPGLQGADGRREDQLAVQGLGDAVQQVAGPAEVGGSVTGAGELGEPAVGQGIAVQFIHARTVGDPFQIAVFAVQVHHFLVGRRQYFFPIPGRKGLVKAISAQGDTGAVNVLSLPGALCELHAFRGFLAADD